MPRIWLLARMLPKTSLIKERRFGARHGSFIRRNEETHYARRVCILAEDASSARLERRFLPPHNGTLSRARCSFQATRSFINLTSRRRHSPRKLQRWKTTPDTKKPHYAQKATALAPRAFTFRMWDRRFPCATALWPV